MSYRIEYSPSAPLPSNKGINIPRTACMTLAVFALLLGTVHYFWPEGDQVLQILKSKAIPPYPVTALDAMLQQLRSGVSLSDAVTAFCRDVVQQGLNFAA